MKYELYTIVVVYVLGFYLFSMFSNEILLHQFENFRLGIDSIQPDHDHRMYSTFHQTVLASYALIINNLRINNYICKWVRTYM